MRFVFDTCKLNYLLAMAVAFIALFQILDADSLVTKSCVTVVCPLIVLAILRMQAMVHCRIATEQNAATTRIARR
ncbi:MAG: hypothetical protein ACRD3W_02210 [Terriglobales bacterium]